MKYLIIFNLYFMMCLCSSSAFANNQERITELEAQVKDLSQRLTQLEGQLKSVKTGGFTITPVVNCELTTPFDGQYTASELSKSAATNAVIEKCKEKANNKAECFSSRVVCN